MAQFSKIKPGSCSIRETQRTEQTRAVQAPNTRLIKLEPASSLLDMMLHQGVLMRISRHRKQIEAKILAKGCIDPTF
jgi:hypothetical protein